MFFDKAQIQFQIKFFDDEPPSVEERKWIVSPDNPACPFSNFIGNRDAIIRLGRAAFKAWERQNHACSDFSFFLCGPASTGKTTLARLLAKVVLLPFIEIQPQSLKKVHDVFDTISKNLDAYEVDGAPGILSLAEMDSQRYIAPPCVVFIDEVDQLVPKVLQGLLKATEQSDHQMETEKGVHLDTSNICFVIATTSRGDLKRGAAFDTRFEKIRLSLYSEDEVARIIQLKNPDLSFNICEKIAYFSNRVPREALDFTKDFLIAHEMEPDIDLDDLMLRIADEHGIDPFGMTYQRLSLLTALGQSPIGANRLVYAVNPPCEKSELNKYVLPALLEGERPLITVSKAGFCITETGLFELEKRGIEYNHAVLETTSA